MKKIVFLSLLFTSLAVQAQVPDQVRKPQWFLTWIKVSDSVRANIYFQGSGDTLATRAYARSLASGGIAASGYGIAIVNDTIMIDTAHYRKMDSLYVITDSTFIIKINGNFTSFKMRGAVFSFNGRAGAVAPQRQDYAAFSPLLDSTYNDPFFIHTLNFSKIINTGNSLASYGIVDGVLNTGGGYGYGSGGFSSRPVEGKFGNLYYASDSAAFYWDDGTKWNKIVTGGGSGTLIGILTPGSFIYGQTTSQVAGGPLVNDTTNTRIKFNVPIFVNNVGASILDKGTTAQRPASPISGMIRFNIDSAGYEQYNGSAWTKFGPGSGGSGGTMTQLIAGRGLTGGTVTTSGTFTVDTTLIPRFADTSSILVTRTFLSTRGFLTTETDPVATAKLITVNVVANGGILRTGTAAQSVGSGASWSLQVDSSIFVTSTMLGRKTSAAGTAGNLAYLTAAGTLFTAPIKNDTTNGQVVISNTVAIPATVGNAFKQTIGNASLSGLTLSGTSANEYDPISVGGFFNKGAINYMGNTSTQDSGRMTTIYSTGVQQDVAVAYQHITDNSTFVTGVHRVGTSSRFGIGWASAIGYRYGFVNVSDVLQLDSLGRMYLLKGLNRGAGGDSVLVRNVSTGEIKQIGPTSISITHKSGIWDVYSSALGDTLFNKGWKTSADAYIRTGTDSINNIIFRANGVAAGSYTSANITVDSTGRVTAAANGTGGGGSSNTFSKSLVDSSDNVTLLHDVDSPGVNRLYAIDKNQRKGWTYFDSLKTILTIQNIGSSDDSLGFASLTGDTVSLKRQRFVATNGMSVTKTGSTLLLNKYNFQLGQVPMTVGDPAAITAITEIPFSGSGEIYWSGRGSKVNTYTLQDSKSLFLTGQLDSSAGAEIQIGEVANSMTSSWGVGSDTTMFFGFTSALGFGVNMNFYAKTSHLSFNGNVDSGQFFQVYGTSRFTDTMRLTNLKTKSDSAAYKPLVKDANGNVFALNYWPGGGGSGLSYPNTVKKYLNGYGTFAALNTDSLTEGTANKFYTDARVRAAVSALPPILFNISTGVFSADTSTGRTHFATQSMILDSAAALRKIISSSFDSATTQGGGFHTERYNDIRYLFRADSTGASGFTTHAQSDTLRNNLYAAIAANITNLTTNVSGILPAANGGTSNGFTAFTGPTSSTKTFTLPNASAMILTSNAAVTVAQGGFGTGTGISGIVFGTGTAYRAATSSDNYPGNALNITGVAGVANGGTSFSSYTTGDILYASSSSALSRLADAAVNNVLISGGAGVAPSYGKVNLGSMVSSTLSVNAGGTGLVSYTVGDLLFASGTTTISKLNDVALGSVLVSGGTSTAPSYSTSIPNGVTATTQTAKDSSTKVANDLYVDRAVATLKGGGIYGGSGSLQSGTTTVSMPGDSLQFSGNSTSQFSALAHKYIFTGAGTSPNFTMQSAFALSYATANSGTSYTLLDGTSVHYIDLPTLAAAFTVTLSASPVDGQLEEIHFGGTISSGPVVTALTISPNSGQSIIDAVPVTSAAAGDCIMYRWNALKNAYYRVK